MSEATRGWWRDLRRAVSWHRKLLAAGLAAATVAVGLQALQPSGPRTVLVLTAARDLQAGTVLVAGDLLRQAFPESVVPTGALGPTSDLEGRTVAGAVRAGEAITDVRLVGPSLVGALGDGLVATPVRVSDAGSAALVRPGDRIDLLATPVSLQTAGSPTRTVASDVVILAVPGDADAYAEGALIVVATTSAVAADLAGAAVTDRISITLRG